MPALAQLPHLQSQGSNGEILHLNPDTDLGDDVSLKIKELLEYCSRYVFAPICRGVTSKRASISPLVGNNHAIFDLILRQIKKQQEENTKSEAIELPQQLTKDNYKEVVAESIRRYNMERPHDSIGMKTPCEIHDGIINPLTTYFRDKYQSLTLTRN